MIGLKPFVNQGTKIFGWTLVECTLMVSCYGTNVTYRLGRSKNEKVEKPKHGLLCKRTKNKRLHRTSSYEQSWDVFFQLVHTAPKHAKKQASIQNHLFKPWSCRASPGGLEMAS